MDGVSKCKVFENERIFEIYWYLFPCLVETHQGFDQRIAYWDQLQGIWENFEDLVCVFCLSQQGGEFLLFRVLEEFLQKGVTLFYLLRRRENH